jgi:TP901 family phage tail tape measure protein
MAINLPIVSKFDDKGIKQADQALSKFGKAAGAIAAAATAAVAGIAVVSIKEFAKFDAALTKSTAIMGNVSEALRNDMAEAAKEVAKTTTFSAEQAAESYFFLASAGLDAAASIKAMPQVAQFAQAGMFDMALATDLLTDAQSALGLTVRNDGIKNLENMAKVSDVLVRANTLANASVEQFSTALTNKAGPAMRAVGMDIEEGVAVLAAFADQGIKGEVAGTNFAIVLRDLQTKALANKEAFAQAGVSVFDASGEFNNMGDIVGDLELLLGGMSDETKKATLTQLGFSDKSMASISALLGMSEAIKGYEGELRNAAGTTQEIADKQLQTLAAQFDLLKSKVTDIGLTIGEALVPVVVRLMEVFERELQPVLEQFGDWLKSPDGEEAVIKLGEAIVGVVGFLIDFGTWIANNLELVKNLGITFGVIAVSVKLYTTAVQLAAIANALFTSSLLLNPVFLMVAAVAGLTAMFIANNGAVEDNVETYKKMKEAESNLAYTAKGTADRFKESAYVQDKYGVVLDATTKAAQNTATKVQYLGTEVARADQAKFANLPGQLNNVTIAADGTTVALDGTKKATVELTLVEQARERYNQEQITTMGRSTRTFEDFLTGMTRNAAATITLNEETTKTTKTFSNLGGSAKSAASDIDKMTVASEKLASVAKSQIQAGFQWVTGPNGTYLMPTSVTSGSYSPSTPGGEAGLATSVVSANLRQQGYSQSDIDKILTTAVGGTAREIQNSFNRGVAVINEATNTMVMGNLGSSDVTKLQAQGYEVVGKISASQDEITKALSDLTKTITSGGAGNYLTPLAKGGIVTGPTRALIGEAGPEAVIPLNRLDSMGGNTYNVTVNAGIGSDGGRIGQIIVDEIKKFERSNGPVFAGA